jgi:hypothetical protein
LSDFDFLDGLRQLSPDAQERFKRVINRFFSGELISPGPNPLAPDLDWRFMERNAPLVSGYLSLAGWEIEHLPAHRIYRAVHAAGAHRVQVTVLESMIACILRQAYHAHMANPASGERQCELDTGDLRERLASARRTSSPEPRKNIAVAVRRLRRLGLVEVTWPYQAEDDEVLVVGPLVESVLSMEKVQAFWAEYDRQMASRSGTESLEDAAVFSEEDAEEEETATDA